MASAPVYHKASGRVVEVIPPFKAVVEFKITNIPARALLKVEKIPHEHKPNDQPKNIADLLQIGSIVKFSCHTFDETREDRCGWYVAELYSIYKTEYDIALYSNITLCPTVVNGKGRIQTLEDRQGTLSLTKEGITYDVMFMANFLYIRQKKFNAKNSLKGFLDIDDYVYFDAVPTDPNENDMHCSWFATLVWQGSRPDQNHIDKPLKENDATLNMIKQITKNPDLDFLRGRGQIMDILSEEYGVILGAVNEKQTNWQSILFHRTKASLFKLKLSKADLRNVFKPGDRVRFIAVRVPHDGLRRSFTTDWVAAQVTIDYDEDALRGI